MTLTIPTAFYSYNGEALDKKTPLLRSMAARLEAGATGTEGSRQYHVIKSDVHGRPRAGILPRR